jgi:DNA-binding NarL/FixJ family response regulator
MSSITVVVVDDHPIFRQGVMDSLSLETDISVIGDAEDGIDGLELIRELHPQIAIVDVNLPGMNGQQVTHQVVSEKIPTRIILLTAYDDTEQKIHAMRVGAHAYCVKDVDPQTLVKIVHTVADGKYFIGDEILNEASIEQWLSMISESALRSYSDPGDPFQPLSSREMEVLSYITQGKSNKEIAALLGISHQTVKNHVTSILRKLGVEDRTQAAIYSLRRGWVRLYQNGSEDQEELK